MNTRESVRREYLAAMGITLWERRVAGPEDSVPAPLPTVRFESAAASGDPGMPLSTDAWTTLEATVRGCTQCPLHAGRKQTVFGVGSRNAQWMFIGEAPGAEEDKQGEPFVGRAGKLLNAMLFAIGLKREQVYIANVLKCRPPGNRDPQPAEVEQCEPYLKRQIALIQPKLIVALGRHAAHSLLRTEQPLNRLRGQKLAYEGIPLLVTYHPAYLLRAPLEKRKAWEDLSRARQWMEALS